MYFSFTSNHLTSYLPSVATTGLASISANMIMDHARSSITKNMQAGFICDRTSCTFGSVGKTAYFCAERVHWLQLMKPAFKKVGQAINLLSAFPCYQLNMKADSIPTEFFIAGGEELVCRGLIQSVILRGLQKKFLGKDSIDQPILKITRIAASALIFGLLHTNVWECRYGGTAPEIAGGMIFGIVAETKLGLLGATIAHAAANILRANLASQ